jgi:hypothetical protein
MTSVIDPFLGAVDAVAGGRYSAVLYGSAARGDYIEGKSDINLMLILDDVGPATLRALGPALGTWQKGSTEPPLLISRQEWGRAGDAFPIEIADMRSAYRILRGPDPLATMEPHRAELRQALERELRGKLLRLRQGYAVLSADPVRLGALAADSAGTVLVLFRSLLVLTGRDVPLAPAAIVSAAADLVGFPAEAVSGVTRHRGDRKWRCEAPVFEAYLDAVATTAGYVDQLQLGDHR